MLSLKVSAVIICSSDLNLEQKLNILTQKKFRKSFKKARKDCGTNVALLQLVNKSKDSYRNSCALIELLRVTGDLSNSKSKSYARGLGVKYAREHDKNIQKMSDEYSSTISSLKGLRELKLSLVKHEYYGDVIGLIPSNELTKYSHDMGQ